MCVYVFHTYSIALLADSRQQKVGRFLTLSPERDYLNTDFLNLLKNLELSLQINCRDYQSEWERNLRCNGREQLPVTHMPEKLYMSRANICTSSRKKIALVVNIICTKSIARQTFSMFQTENGLCICFWNLSAHTWCVEIKDNGPLDLRSKEIVQ